MQALRRAFYRALHRALEEGKSKDELGVLWTAFKEHVKMNCERPEVRPLHASEKPTKFSELEYRVSESYHHSSTAYGNGRKKLAEDIAALDASIEKGEPTFAIGSALPDRPARAAKVSFTWPNADNHKKSTRAALEHAFLLTPNKGALVSWSGPDTDGSIKKGLNGAVGAETLDRILDAATSISREQGRRALFNDNRLAPLRERLCRLHDVITRFSSSWEIQSAKADAKKIVAESIDELKRFTDPNAHPALDLDRVGLPFAGTEKRKGSGWPIDRKVLDFDHVITPLRAALHQAYRFERTSAEPTWIGVPRTTVEGLPKARLLDRLSGDALIGKDPLDEILAIHIQVEMEQGARGASTGPEIAGLISELENSRAILVENREWPTIRSAADRVRWNSYQLIKPS